jgi:hypothetical protein
MKRAETQNTGRAIPSPGRSTCFRSTHACALKSGVIFSFYLFWKSFFTNKLEKQFLYLDSIKGVTDALCSNL